jgi:hypothetical protein
MARARNIKPGFFTNDDLVELPFEARLLFIGLWTIADRAGRLLDRPKKIKMDIFPADDVDVDACLTGLANRGFVQRYEVGDKRIVQITNWEKHQNPHVKEAASTLPAVGHCEQIPAPAQGEQGDKTGQHGGSPVQAPEIPERAGLIPDSLNLIPDTGLPSTTSPSSDDVRQCPAGTLVDLYHELMPQNPQVKVLNAARKGAIKARWLEAAKLDCQPFGYATRSAGIEAWRQFFTICSESRFLTGRSAPTPGKPPFVADIDFLFSASGFARTLEDKYHREVP